MGKKAVKKVSRRPRKTLIAAAVAAIAPVVDLVKVHAGVKQDENGALYHLGQRRDGSFVHLPVTVPHVSGKEMWATAPRTSIVLPTV